MNRRIEILATGLLLVLWAARATLAQTALRPAFTVQGHLTSGGQPPADDSFTMKFRLFDDELDGAQKGDEVIKAVQVVNGLFTEELNSNGEFGPDAFNGEERWLEITVEGVVLAPRRPVTAAPYALFALDAPAGHSLSAADGDPVQAVTVDESGNVGIGATNPTEALEVVGKVKTRGAFSQPETGALTYVNGTGNMYIGPESGTTLNGAAISLAGPDDTLTQVPGGIRFNTTGAVAMVINSNGDVGIGNSAPEELLHVGLNPDGSTIQIGAYTAIGEASSSASTILGDNVKPANFPVDGMEVMLTHPSYGARAIKMNLNEGIGFHVMGGPVTAGTTFSSEAMRIANDGNVGIGTTTPGEKLDVAGNIRATGCVIASNLTCPSDARFKDHIEPVAGALDKVEQLRGVTFDWRRDEFCDHHFAEGRQVGFIAQEVEAVLPQVVSKGSDGYLSVDYGRLTPLLVEAMKELKAENAELKARLKKLEARNKE